MHHLIGRSRVESGELKSVFSAAEFDSVAKIEMQWLGKRACVDTSEQNPQIPYSFRRCILLNVSMLCRLERIPTLVHHVPSN